MSEIDDDLDEDLDDPLIPELDDSPESWEVKENFYINPNDFLEQIRLYYETDEMTNDLAENIVKIAEHLALNWRFIEYSSPWKDEMIGDAKIKMYKALEGKKFDPDKGFSPFAYFNRIAWFAFANRIKREKAQHAGFREYRDFIYEKYMSDGNVYVKPHIENDEDGGYGYDD